MPARLLGAARMVNVARTLTVFAQWEAERCDDDIIPHWCRAMDFCREVDSIFRPYRWH